MKMIPGLMVSFAPMKGSVKCTPIYHNSLTKNGLAVNETSIKFIGIRFLIRKDQIRSSQDVVSKFI